MPISKNGRTLLIKAIFLELYLQISQRHLDCLDHELLTAKLNACGFSLPALRFMTTYQTENKGQRFMIIIVLGQKYYLAFRKGQFLNFGEYEIKTWKPDNCPCRLCKVYTESVGFL